MDTYNAAYIWSDIIQTLNDLRYVCLKSVLLINSNNCYTSRVIGEQWYNVAAGVYPTVKPPNNAACEKLLRGWDLKMGKWFNWDFGGRWCSKRRCWEVRLHFASRLNPVVSIFDLSYFEKKTVSVETWYYELAITHLLKTFLTSKIWLNFFQNIVLLWGCEWLLKV